MAKKSKSKQPVTTKKKSARQQSRGERRFVSQASTKPLIIYGLGWAAAAVLGAGAWAYFYAKSLLENDQLKQYPAYIVAAGLVMLGVAIWLGTSNEPPLRVGDPGIALEKGELRRMPWWAVSKITFDAHALAIAVEGKDESNSDWSFKVPLKAHPEGIGWLIKEALERIPRKVQIEDSTLDKLPAASEHAGQRIILEALQVVGKRCAATNKTISYEPDARVCSRCERVYERKAVPKKCKCGNSLAHLQSKDAADHDDIDENENEHETDNEDAESETAES